MTARIGVVSAAPAVDRTHLVPELRPGTIHRPARVLALPGGKGLNVAHVLRTLGADVVISAPLAGATGRWLAEAATASGLDVRPTWVPGELRTCVSVFAETDGSLTEFYEPPLPVAPADWDRFTADMIAVMADRALAAVAVSGRMPPDAPADGLATIVRTLVAAGVFVAVDADGPGLRAAIEARPALVKVNGSEAAALLGRTVETRDEAIRAADSLRDTGAGAAVITLGRDGAVAVDEDGRAWRVAAPVVDGHYPTGSGDAFLAGMLAARAMGATFPDQLRLAVGAAAANTEQPGAGIVDPDRARALAAGVVAEAVDR